MLLLDTCTFFWLTSRQQELSPAARDSIARNAEALYVSAISGLELALKHHDGKLHLPTPAPIWFPAALAAHGLQVVPVTADIAIASALLPRIHNDPFDRILLATASLRAMTIVTPDREFPKYPGAQVLW